MNAALANRLLAADVLVVDDNRPARDSIAIVLGEAGHRVRTCASGREALAMLEQCPASVVVTDVQMPGMSGLELLQEIHRRKLRTQVLTITAHASVSMAVEAMRHGAFDYLEKPFDVARLENAVSQALACADVRGGLQEVGAIQESSLATSTAMVGSSPAMQRVRSQIACVAATDETVLIVGESGTGKELVARAIHDESRRQAGPWVSLNCPALSEQLTESELFGHRRGAFTGAEQDRTGRFELADRGTLLLDEITEVSPAVQAKLLRVLQERCFERVGESTSIAVDVRVLATTNRDLASTIAAGQFREDLYYRLAVVPIHLPPLRERGDDVVELAEHFLGAISRRMNRSGIRLEPRCWDLLLAYRWPGNVRELQNLITRAAVLCADGQISSSAIEPWLGTSEKLTEVGPVPSTELVGLSLAETERRLILETLEHCQGHRQRTAAMLGIGVRTLSGKLRLYGVAPGDDRVRFAA